MLSALLRAFMDAFTGEGRAEPTIIAERIVPVFDFTAYYSPVAIEVVGIKSCACFLFKKNEAGQTIIRSKGFSHMPDWNDDETVTLFDVGLLSLPDDGCHISFLTLVSASCSKVLLH